MTLHKGRLLPAEGGFIRDPETGAEVRQWTDHPAVHHHLYFFNSSYPDHMAWLCCVSYRSGAPNLFAIDRKTGRLRQLTDRHDLAPFTPALSRDGRWIYFSAGCTVWRLDTETLSEEPLASFPGDRPGVCSLSADGRFVAVPLKSASGDGIAVIDLEAGRAETILRRDEVFYVQFSPVSPDWVQYTGPHVDRLWVVRRDGTGNRRLYQQAPSEWVTHETWLGGDEVIFAQWPHALLAVGVADGHVRTVSRFNAWHPSGNRAGTAVVCDTVHPDIGLQLVDPRTGARHTLCRSEASSQGDHWKGPFPYAKKPYNVTYPPQYTHPHPSFSPDGCRVVFTSDRSGHSQVYEVPVPTVQQGKR